MRHVFGNVSTYLNGDEQQNKQLREARNTLAAQLPVFPELARSLKTQVSSLHN
jgi:hypothetical protein